MDSQFITFSVIYNQQYQQLTSCIITSIVTNTVAIHSPSLFAPSWADGVGPNTTYP